ncbi:DUF1428 domain-containing protein [Bordetella holmesii]|uniref:PF07237 family protein n=2 Tax=Bordetella holmesii TaxID=35814 RepID=A0A158MB92_9BORD|nr:DUF1428 family protein [Bordetella holmesii]AHV94744.1 hypothetical protein D560_3790 [Bordetella holmesii ATCC 51541]AIT28404.1 hypothetical protein D558_3764 [Bordetella holmesii 44057]EWM41194.1 hypothetical protein D555_3839 [Bordetella holmesii 35009]EWM42599.1 hypothetical protein D556_3767 [Bordetella holmesii 41130]EWM45085.1 hypothetical protein D557_3074 [Bordetella holmesii 70147]
MTEYVDGYVLAIPSDKLETYRTMAAHAAKVWLAHGALAYRECVGDALDPQHGMRDFRDVAEAGESDIVIFAWIVFSSKSERDRINAIVMNDPRLMEVCVEGVFDPRRMAYGGFQTLVQA